MPNDPTNRVTSQASRAASPDAIVDWLFIELATIFGRQWAEMWDGVPIDLVKSKWAAALTGCSPEMVKLALQAILDKGMQYPPNMAQFVSLVRQFRRHGDAPRLVDGRRTAPDGYFQSLRDVLKRAGDVPRETED